MRPIHRLVLGLTVLPFLASNVAAQIPAEEYAARRDSLAARMGPGVLLAFGAPSPVTYDFQLRQLPAFNYITGFLEPNAAMVLVHGDDGVRHTLFTERPTVRTQLYDGFREDPAALARRTGARVRPLEDLGPYVDSLASTGVSFFELRDFASGDNASTDSLTRGRAFVESLQARHPGLQVTDLHRDVRELRARKSPAEVALLRKAIAITDQAHRAALAVIEPGVWEYQVEATIEFTYRNRGADGPAYSSIVGSGLNSTVLHYVANDRQMEAGDLVLMDVGAQVAGYAADITRTVPVSGAFTPDQRAIYDLVLAAEKAAEAQVRPGASPDQSLAAATQVRLQGMADLGLIQSPDATYDPPWPVDCETRPDQCLQGMLFMIHGISHGIGLEVHDPSQFSIQGEYAPGDVFTIEPGIYINAQVLDMLPDTPKNRAFVEAVGETVRRYHEIGVRIEDNYLVTNDGAERLSAAPREVEEIETGMAGGR
ncbi:MAG: aminopeptidase P N-terminal domain-containing protein [Gemmatimonadota bacterium]|jgi:Xaa-Pro aminopeptidase